MSFGSTLIKIAKKGFHLVGYDLKRYSVASNEDLLIKTILETFKIGTVIDVGGNIGQYGLGLVENGFRGQIHTFEPISSMFEELKKNSKRHRNWTVHNYAIGSAEGEHVIHITENFASSSLLPINDASVAAAPWTRMTNEEKIKVQTLDYFFDKTIPIQGNLMLKLDVQGYELEALRGGNNTLAKASIVQSEVSFIPLNEGAPLFEDIVAYMKEKGFEIYTIIPGFRDMQTGRMLQADTIFVRKTN